MQNTTENSAEIVFLGDGPGQADVLRIGDREYRRGETYVDVPPGVLRRGGFYHIDDLGKCTDAYQEPLRPVIVLGTGPGMFEDLDGAPGDCDIIAVNGAGILYLEPITYWISIHGSELVKWIEERRVRGGDMNFQAHGNFSKGELSGDVVRRNVPNGQGSSGLYAALFAIERGYNRIILCGVPLEGERRTGHDGKVVKARTDYSAYRCGWEQRRELLVKYVRSMSGWTRELLGAPTDEWIHGHETVDAKNETFVIR